MFIKTLRLRNFRSIDEAEFTFYEGMNLITGPNASGKTTLIEALHLLIVGRSFRARTLKELIAFKADFFLIEALFEKHGVEQSIRMVFDGNERTVYINKRLCPSILGLLGLLTGVFSTPQDGDLLKGPPQVRRQFLDVQIAQRDPMYVHHLSRYSKALRQRNALLRQQKSGALESFEAVLSQAAAYVTLKREQTIAELLMGARKAMEVIGEIEKLKLLYRSDIVSSLTEKERAQAYVKRYKELRSREWKMGYTLAGPHRHDLLIMLQERDARYYASEGQRMSIANALKCAEWMLLKERSEHAPVMVFDDFGLGMDERRKEALQKEITNFSQVFVTSAANLKWEGATHQMTRSQTV